jgi:hypothetical protein
MLCLPYYAYVFLPTKLEIRGEWGRGWGKRAGGRNDPMYAHVNK